MITNINEWKKMNENSPVKKNIWWKANHEKLITVASSYLWENWMSLLKNNEDVVHTTMYNNNKHKALVLFNMHDINKLNEIINI